MKRNILIIITFMLATLSTWAASPQHTDKSEAEKLVQSLAKIKSDEISYAYISMNMFKHIFASFELDEEDAEELSFLKSLKSLRRLSTDGKQSYDIVKKALTPFLEEREEVMGMTLMAANRDSGGMVAIYSGQGNTLVVTDCGNDTTITLVFVAGLSYKDFLLFNEMNINF